MDGEQESIAQVEAETPSEKAVEPNEPEDLETGPDAGDEEAQDDGFDDLEWEGIKARVPRELKPVLEERLGLFSKGFTTKTQETAALRKELEQGKESLAQQFKVSEEEMNARAAMISIDSDIKSYENVDWDKWLSDDLVAAQQAFVKYQNLKEAYGKVTGYLDQRQKARTVETQRETAQRLQATRQFAETKIKGWTPEVDAKITEFALGKLKDHGITRDTLIGTYNPGIYEILHLAYLGHQAISKPTSAPKAPPITEPLRVVAAKANPPARKSLSDMSMEEYAAHRTKQIAAREGR